jgi:acetyltransferase
MRKVRWRWTAASVKPAGVAHFAIRPYPDEWESRVAWQGQTLLLRPIRPEDEAAHQAFLDAVTADDLWLRFFQAPHRLSHDELARLTQIDYEREMAFIAVDAAQQTLGVARLVRDPDNTEAEFAVLVRSDLQGRGLGRLLMQRLLDYATARGTQRIVGDVLRENHGMLSLAKALGFEMSADAHDPVHVVRVTRAVRPALSSVD